MQPICKPIYPLENHLGVPQNLIFGPALTISNFSTLVFHAKKNFNMITPSLTEFHKVLFEASLEADRVANEVYEKAKERGELTINGEMRDGCSIGSTIMYLDKRKPLFKFFANLRNEPQDFYGIHLSDRELRISLRNIRLRQSYTMHRAVYDVIVTRLREAFGWEIYNNVNPD
ncbi:MAG: hypothetical protein ABIN36_13215 [Ferruginibacter sp.]